MSVVLYGGEMAGVRHVSGVLFTMVMRWPVSGVLFSYGGEMAGVRHVS